MRRGSFQGKVTVKGEGYDEVLNYWAHLETKEQPKTTLGTKWDAADAAQIMGDLRTLRRTMIQSGGFTPHELICGSKVLDTILDKLTTANQLDTRRVDMGAIDPQHLPNGVTYWGYLKDSGLDIYSYDEWYTDDAGKEQPMVPENSACSQARTRRRCLLTAWFP